MPKNKQNRPQTEDEWFSDTKREDLGYKFILNNQLQAIAKAATSLSSEYEVEIFSNAVWVLENLLWPYCSNEEGYKKIMKEIEEEEEKRSQPQELLPEELRRKLYSYQISNVIAANKLRIMIWRETKRWRALMVLMSRKELLLERQTFEEIG